MPLINAFRMNGLGNNFTIVDRRKDLINISKEAIVKLGNLVSFHRDISFDQIIFIEKEINKVFPITIFNSDGCEVSACGNGSRCVAYFLSKDLNTKTIKLKTSNRHLNATIIGDFDVLLEMGKPIFDWDKIPLIKKIDHDNITLNIDDKIFADGFCLNVGNPHIIFFVKDCFEYDLKILGPKIENYELFPEKINVTFAQVNDKNNITVNVWERGAGLTKACGTAACATAVASSIKKLDYNNITLNIDNKISTNGFCLNVGNPHIVFFVKDCFEYDLKILGPKIENHKLFPEKINVTFAQINDKNNITVNVWERGAGLTKACGTAACATAVASLMKKLTENDINIKFKKGNLNIKINEDLNIFMTGPVSDIKHTKLEI